MYPCLEKTTVPTDTGPVTVVQFIDDARDFDSIDACRDQLRAINPATKTVVDLGDVPLLRSSLVAGIVALNRATGVRGGRLCVCRVAPAMRDALRRMRLDKLLQLEDSREDAIQAVCTPRLTGSRTDTSPRQAGTPPVGETGIAAAAQ